MKGSRDHNGTVHVYDFDKLGRPTQDRATTLGSGVDGGVRRIATTYEVRGMRETITSWNAETVGSGSVVNQVQFAYNEFGQLTHDYQAHGGTVNTSTSPRVQYGYASGSANTIRPTTRTYPDGRVLTFSYGASDSLPDALSRVAGLVDDDVGSTHLADYAYLDLIDRLQHMDRGRLNAEKDGVTNKTFALCWSLDFTGNWRKFLEDDDGTAIGA